MEHLIKPIITTPWKLQFMQQLLRTAIEKMLQIVLTKIQIKFEMEYSWISWSAIVFGDKRNILQCGPDEA